MNKSELIEVAATEADISKAAAGRALDAILDAVVKAVAKGDTVTLVGFGTFKSSKRAARTGRNPQTGAEIKIAASTGPRFTAGAGFKTAVAGKKAAKMKCCNTSGEGTAHRGALPAINTGRRLSPSRTCHVPVLAMTSARASLYRTQCVPGHAKSIGPVPILSECTSRVMPDVSERGQRDDWK